MLRGMRRDSCLRLSESWFVRPESQNLVEEAIACIYPDDTEIALWWDRYSKGQKKRLIHDVEQVRRYIQPGQRVLEFGALPPILTVALTRAGFGICGLDLKPERFRTTIEAERLDVRKVNFETEQLPFADGEWDAAVFNEVFEHLRINPIFTLRRASKSAEARRSAAAVHS